MKKSLERIIHWVSEYWTFQLQNNSNYGLLVVKYSGLGMINSSPFP